MESLIYHNIKLVCHSKIELLKYKIFVLNNIYYKFNFLILVNKSWKYVIIKSRINKFKANSIRKW